MSIYNHHLLQDKTPPEGEVNCHAQKYVVVRLKANISFQGTSACDSLDFISGFVRMKKNLTTIGNCQKLLIITPSP